MRVAALEGRGKPVVGLSEVREDQLAPVVVIATRGRPCETEKLLSVLSYQNKLPSCVAVVGVSLTDLPRSNGQFPFPTIFLLSEKAGLTAQRNQGVLELQRNSYLNHPDHFVVFFDDDFRPRATWLQEASNAFAREPRLAGLTGQVLADGVKGGHLAEGEAENILLGRAKPQRHWSSGDLPRLVDSLYGCNMAVRADVASSCRFDEELPLYGWQEDCDYTGQVRRLGEARIVPFCQGVHLGVKSARSSGLRLGYSQVANPLHIAARKNMRVTRMLRFILKALVANVAKTLLRRKAEDYRGRLKGNALALVDLMHRRCSPGRILEL